MEYLTVDSKLHVSFKHTVNYVRFLVVFEMLIVLILVCVLVRAAVGICFYHGRLQDFFQGWAN